MLPFAYVLMSKKTAVAYTTVFSFIKTDFAPMLRPAIIMTDYESALYRSLMKAYPEAEVHGCFFQFCQVIISYCQATTTISVLI